MQKPAISSIPLQETIANRWSGRAYDAAKKVSQEQIIALLEAARWAPSCYGDQPWRLMVWDKHQNEQAWQQAFECLVLGNQAWVKDAPVLMLSCANTVFGHNNQPNRWAQYDTGAAAENLCLQATDLGLMAHQMGGFNADKAREEFAIPSQYTPMAMVSIGYPADIATVTGEALTREMTERKRKALGELFFAGAWGKPIQE